jgi:phosphate transport system ATP-binding protein
MKSQDMKYFIRIFQALHKINMDMNSTGSPLSSGHRMRQINFLRTLNRLHELIEGTVIKGQVFLDEEPFILLRPM